MRAFFTNTGVRSSAEEEEEEEGSVVWRARTPMDRPRDARDVPVGPHGPTIRAPARRACPSPRAQRRDARVVAEGVVAAGTFADAHIAAVARAATFVAADRLREPRETCCYAAAAEGAECSARDGDARDSFSRVTSIPV